VSTVGLVRFDGGWFEFRGDEPPGLVVLKRRGDESGGSSVAYQCINLACAGREVGVDRGDRVRWVHTDTGLALCDPTSDSLRRALPRPPAERIIATPT
jgi:hypothetical protein